MEQSVEEIFRLNEVHSKLYVEQEKDREEYLKRHPTRVVVTQCMDGRINFPVITGTLLGIVQQYRNIGGKFDIGWPGLADNFKPIRQSAQRSGNKVLVLVTYHYSEGSEHRGCAGFEYDRSESIRYMKRLRGQFHKVHHGLVCPLLVGIETDSDALILHGQSGGIVNLATLCGKDDWVVERVLNEIYPEMPEEVLRDFMPFVHGNIRHIESVKGRKPLTDFEHREWILGVGSGFESLCVPNTAIIVGPRSPNIAKSLQKAAGIIKSNLDLGRIGPGIVLLSSAVAEDEYEVASGTEQANFLGRFTRDVLRESNNFPQEFLDSMHRLNVVVEQWSRKIRVAYDEAPGTKVCEIGANPIAATAK